MYAKGIMPQRYANDMEPTAVWLFLGKEMRSAKWKKKETKHKQKIL